MLFLPLLFTTCFHLLTELLMPSHQKSFDFVLQKFVNHGLRSSSLAKIMSLVPFYRKEDLLQQNMESVDDVRAPLIWGHSKILWRLQCMSAHFLEELWLGHVDWPSSAELLRLRDEIGRHIMPYRNNFTIPSDADKYLFGMENSLNGMGGFPDAV